MRSHFEKGSRIYIYLIYLTWINGRDCCKEKSLRPLYKAKRVKWLVINHKKLLPPNDYLLKVVGLPFARVLISCMYEVRGRRMDGRGVLDPRLLTDLLAAV